MKFSREYERLMWEEVLKEPLMQFRDVGELTVVGSHDPVMGFSYLIETPRDMVKKWYVDGEIVEWEFEEALERIMLCNPDVLEQPL